MIGAVGRLRLSLRAKIVGPFVLIVALVGTIGTAAVTGLVTSEAVAGFSSRLLPASLVAHEPLSLDAGDRANREVSGTAFGRAMGGRAADGHRRRYPLLRRGRRDLLRIGRWRPPVLARVNHLAAGSDTGHGPARPTRVVEPVVQWPGLHEPGQRLDDAQGAAWLPGRGPQTRATPDRARPASTLPSDPLRR